MKVYDLSIALRPGMVVWPDDPEPALQSHLSTRQGDPCNVARLTLGTHNGTHIDAPLHYFSNGKTVEQVPLDRLIGPTRVVEVAGEQDIGAVALETLAAAGALPPGTERVIFKTRNTLRRLLEEPFFHTDYVAVTPEGAEWLVAHGVKTVGVDYLSVETCATSDERTHRTLLAAEILIIEGLNLHGVPPGDYTLVCGALKLAGGDGAPARVFLLPPCAP